MEVKERTEQMNMTELVVFLQTEYPELVQSMKDSNHHYDEENLNPYHLEGDVWTHTMLVTQALEKFKFHNQFDIVKIGAILHDLGKPLAREEVHEKKRARFIGHEGISFHLAVDVVNKIFDRFKPFDAESHSNVNKKILLEAIALHGTLFKMSKTKFEKSFNKMFQYNPALAQTVLGIALADGTGRYYQDEAPETMEQFENKVAPLISKLDSKIQVLTDRDIGPFAGDINDRPYVKIMVGLPASGKSTYAQKEAKTTQAKIISRDNLVEELSEVKGISYDDAWKSDFPFDEVIRDSIRTAVKDGRSIIVDMTHMGPKSRRRSMASIPKEYIKIVTVITEPFNTIVERNAKRVGKTITMKTLVRMMKEFVPPMYNDFDSIEYPNLGV